MDHVNELRKAAKEIRKKGYAGWGNACDDAATHIVKLENELRIISTQRDDTYKLLQEAREKLQRVTFGTNNA
jgi:pyridoxal biosynthesis lyase PdxS